MKKVKFLIFLIIGIGRCFLSQAQKVNLQNESGIFFAKGIDWNQLLAKAKVEHKYIFLDCYTTWCAPCKMMSQEIFTQKEVGDYFNTHFISVSIQMDRTAKDDTNIRKWYRVADSLHKILKINSYPTFLFLSPDGNPIHRAAGTMSADEFITLAKEAFDPLKQSYTLLKEWRSHETDSIYLLNTLKAATNTQSEELKLIGNAYLNSLKDPLTKENISLFDHLIQSRNDTIFKLYSDNRGRIDSIAGNKHAEDILCLIIFKAETAHFFEKENSPVSWNAISTKLQRDYPELGVYLLKTANSLYRNKISEEITVWINNKQFAQLNWDKIHKKTTNRYPGDDGNLVFLQVKLDYCKQMQLNRERVSAATEIMNQYGHEIGDRSMNDIIWDDIFNVTGNRAILLKSLQWMKGSVARDADYEAMDTYANLLYKTGNLKDALIWENKAIDLASKNKIWPKDADNFRSNIEKMNKKQPTWADNTAVPKNISL